VKRSRSHRQPASEARREPNFSRSETATAKPAPAARGAKPAPKGSAGRKPALRGGLRRRIFRFAVQWSLVLGLWAAIAIGALFAFYAYQLPPIDSLIEATRRPGYTVLASDGSRIGSSGDLYGTAWRVDQLPKFLPAAVVAIEDRRFYHHFGVDLLGLARAAWSNHVAGRVVQGGSTLTQQVAKNVFLTPERSFRRKVQEVMLALWLEHKFTKDQILGIYLNRVYFGAGAYGVDAASLRYFGKPATKLDLLESAVLAGMLKAPVRYSPAHDPVAAAARAATVLAAMVDTGAVSQLQADSARAAASGLARAAQPVPGRYFTDWVLDQLPDYINADRDLTIATTIDPIIQRAAEAATEAMLGSEGVKRKVSQAAVVVLGADGAVKAMVGGRLYADSQFNRATLAKRQPGSSFKLFVYLAALEAGLSPESTVLDAPIRIGDWAPHNYEGRFEGTVTLTDAVAHSLNTAAVRVAQFVGVKRIAAMAHRLGIAEPLGNDLSLALGSHEVSPIELAGAYATVASGGIAVWPYGVQRITGRAGEILFRRSGSGPERVLTPGVARDMDIMLGAVVTSGTGKAAQFGPRIAGKTGTTSDYKDAWFVGYAGGLTTAVWMGNDDNRLMDKVTGGDLPAKLWRAVMQGALPALATGDAKAIRVSAPAVP
jgi:penicillin-binding protein 1A